MDYIDDKSQRQLTEETSKATDGEGMDFFFLKLGKSLMACDFFYRDRNQCPFIPDMTPVTDQRNDSPKSSLGTSEFIGVASRSPSLSLRSPPWHGIHSWGRLCHLHCGVAAQPDGGLLPEVGNS